MRLKDKAIIITGSTTGIGEAMAHRFVAEGARVLVHGSNRERGEKVVASLGKNSALHIDDLGDPDAPQRIVDAAIKAFGKLDCLVNNAAITTRSNINTTDIALFDRMIAINLRAPMFLIKASLEHLKISKGAILNIGSINAYTGESQLLPYSISKGGLMTLSRNLANSLCNSQVRVTHFNVGWVLTDNEYKVKIKDGLPPDWPQRIGKDHMPGGRLIKPEEIAAAAVFWLSDEPGPISGSVVELEQHPVIGRNPDKAV